MAEEFLKDHGCSCCNGHHDEDEGIKLNEVGTCSCGCGDDEDDDAGDDGYGDDGG